MKLNATPRHYMPLPQNQSDDDESVPSKDDKGEKVTFKNTFNASEGSSKITRIVGQDEVDPKNLPMSPLRLTLFILSLITCVLFVIIFVFCVPCTMPQSLNEICYLTFKWQKILHNMTFTAPLDFVDQIGLKSRLIILGFTSTESGLIAIQETDGKVMWKLHLHSLPLSTSCNTLDINSDGVPECLVIGDKGLLTAIDSKQGVSMWYLHNHRNLNGANSINGPAVVPDCDEDGVKDIVISYNIVNDENGSHLALVSGGTGQIIGSLIGIPECNEPALMKFTWELKNDNYLVLHCTTVKSDELWILSSKEICDAAINATQISPTHNIFRIPHFAENIQFYAVSGSDSKFVIALDGSQIMLVKKSPFNLKILWNTYIGLGQHMRIVADGQFVNGSDQLVITSSDGYHSKILGLGLVDGRKVWSINRDNGTVISATKLEKFFGDTDGLLLKMISSENVLNPNLLKEVKISNSSDHINHKVIKKVPRSGLRLLQESFVFVKCGKVPVIKTILEENIWIFCKEDGACQPNVHTTNPTVIVRAEENGSFNMLTVTSTALSKGNTKEIIVKCLNLKNLSTHARCTG